MIDIQKDSITSKMPTKIVKIGTIIGLAFCSIMTYLCAMPLIEGTHPELPRSFFLTMTLCASGFAFAMIYGLLNHLIEIKINLAEKRIFLRKRVMGHEEKRTINFAGNAHFTEEITSRYDQKSRKQRVYHDIQFVNGKKAFKIFIYNSEEDAKKIKDIAQDHNIAHKNIKTGLNIWVAGGTFFFMAIMMIELYFMGAFD